MRGTRVRERKRGKERGGSAREGNRGKEGNREEGKPETEREGGR